MKSKLANSFISWVVAVAFLLPLSVSGGGVSGKPIDLVLSDIFLMIFLVVSIFWLLVKGFFNFPGRVEIYIAFLIVAYSVVMACLGVMSSGEIMAIFSMSKFIKPFLFIGVGWWWAKEFGYSGICRMAYVAGFVLFAIFFSDLLYGVFPQGCGVEGRWGGCVGVFEVYGFPNSSSSFIVILLVVVLSAYFARLRGQLFFISAAFLAILLGILSLSRAAWVFIAWVTVVWACLDGYRMLLDPFRAFGLILLFVFLVGITLLLVMGGDLGAGAYNKFVYSMERSDMTSGRADIWSGALDLISQKPLFGYAFEPFSNHMPGFDTAHNQYLEWLYKIGILGVTVLSMFLMSAASSFVKIYNGSAARYRPALIMLGLGGFLGVMINGLFQPIVSFSLVGNLLMFCVGAVAFFVKEIQVYNKGLTR